MARLVAAVLLFALGFAVGRRWLWGPELEATRKSFKYAESDDGVQPPDPRTVTIESWVTALATLMPSPEDVDPVAEW